ncbi:MAG: response regulator [Endomicrobiales bacterium]
MNTKKKRSIMIVDDEPDIVLVLAEYLEGEGFSVLTAKSGEQAIAKAREHPIDLSIVDISMPVISGIETLTQMKKSKPHLPVIMITAFRDAEKVLEAFRQGANDCIFKPLDFDYLMSSIISSLSK